MLSINVSYDKLEIISSDKDMIELLCVIISLQENVLYTVGEHHIFIKRSDVDDFNFTSTTLTNVINRINTIVTKSNDKVLKTVDELDDRIVMTLDYSEYIEKFISKLRRKNNYYQYLDAYRISDTKYKIQFITPDRYERSDVEIIEEVKNKYYKFINKII